MYCRNNPIKHVDPSGESVVIAGIAITGELIALIGTGIVIRGYLASKAFVKAFTNSVNKGKTIRDNILFFCIINRKNGRLLIIIKLEDAYGRNVLFSMSTDSA